MLGQSSTWQRGQLCFETSLPLALVFDLRQRTPATLQLAPPLGDETALKLASVAHEAVGRDNQSSDSRQNSPSNPKADIGSAGDRSANAG